MSFNSNRNSRDGKPNRMNKTNNEKKFTNDRGSRRAESSPSSSRESSSRSFDKDRKPGKDFSSSRERFPKKDDRRSSDKKSFTNDRDKRSKSEGRYSDRPERGEHRSSDRPRTPHSPRSDKPFHKKEYDRAGGSRKRSEGKPSRSSTNSPNKPDDGIRLNRYIANAGVCSRRKADELIEAGVVSVNGEVVTTLGTKVMPGDDVRYNGERLKREKMVYVLLNKPKDYITTTDDPQERKTVMHLIEKATQERIYPVGRLDRNTTGLLLMTNDGSLAEKLSHPRNSITKIYHVELDKNLIQGDFNKIQFGLELEDGLIKPDDVNYVQGASKREVGIQIHSGKNRIVRRIFESLGYTVVKLDRVIYANLTKKDLPRGRWRYLEEREIVQLKHFMK